MDHREKSIKLIEMLGLLPVRVRPGQKDPEGTWEPRTILQQNHAAVLAGIQNDLKLNVGALFSGKYLDLDVDNNIPEVTAALDYFLPATPYIWGRKSKPRSHRAYVLSEDFDRPVYGKIARFLKSVRLDGKSYSIEIRGGQPESGMFAVMPGSYRADVDEMVEWSHDLDLSASSPQVSAFMLVKRLRLAMAAALIASYWGEGSRNDLSLALSGLLWRIRSSSLVSHGFDSEEEVPDDIFIITEDDCLSIFQAVLSIADPNKSDRRARELNFSNTWKKLEADPTAKVTGGRVYAGLVGGEVGAALVKSLYRLLSDDDGIERLEALAERYVIWNPAGICIDIDLVSLGYPTPWMTKEQAINSLGDQKIVFGDKKIPVPVLIFTSKIIRRVAGLTFDPSCTDKLVLGEFGTMVNQWRGFKVQPSEQRVTDEEIEPFLKYVHEVLAAGDEKAEKWIHSWIADLFQEPGNKPGTALVFVGVQGAGKTFIGEKVISEIIGSSHSMEMSSIENLTNQFNTISDNKIFIQCNEAVHYYQKTVASKLKAIITDQNMVIEPKGINSYRKPNHIHLMFTSNEEGNPVFIDPSPHERRFTVQKVSDRYANDILYWEYLRAWTAISLHKILRWYLDYKYDKKFIARPIDTAAKRDIQRLGVDPEVSWIISKLAGNFPLNERHHEHWWYAFNSASITDNEREADTLRRDVWPDRILMTALEKDYIDYVRAHGRPVYSGSIATVIKKVFPERSMESAGQATVSFYDSRTNQAVKARPRLHNFPTRHEIIAHLRAKFGPIVDQLFDEVDVDLPGTSVKAAALSKEY